MNPFVNKSTIQTFLAIVTFSLFLDGISGAATIREMTLGDFPGTGGAFKHIGTLNDATTTIEGSLFYDSDIYDVMVFRTTGTTQQITVKLNTGAGGDFTINLGTGSDPQLIHEGNRPDIFGTPRIVVPGEYPLLSEPLQPGTYYLGMRSSIFGGPIEYEVEIEQGDVGTPSCLGHMLISHPEDGAIELSYIVRPGWVHQLEQGSDLRSAWAPLEPAVVGDWRTETQSVSITGSRKYFRLRRTAEVSELFPDVNITAETAAYSPENWVGSAIAMCGKRFPDAAWFIEQDQQGDGWFEQFAPASADLQATAARLAAAIHETVHIAASAGGEGTDQRLVFGEGKFLDVPGEPSPMPRSAIVPNLPQVSLDTQYDEIFLDENFGGRGGFVSVLEELNGFTLGHLAELAFRDTFPIKEENQRQGLLTFMLYLEFYLRTARLEQPEKYQQILASSRMVNATRVVWARANKALERSREALTYSDLDTALDGLVFTPENLTEIERLANLVIPCQ